MPVTTELKIRFKFFFRVSLNWSNGRYTIFDCFPSILSSADLHRKSVRWRIREVNIEVSAYQWWNKNL